MINKINEATQYLQQRTAAAPQLGIILGSGLGNLAESIENAQAIDYKDIPHFKASTAPGHKGRLIFGALGGKSIVAMQGRLHYYEGHSLQELTFPVRVMAALGVKTLLVTNAAGGLNPEFNVGDLMVITDHINFMPNPLIGPNLDMSQVNPALPPSPRFPDMTCIYSPRLVRLADKLASQQGIALQHGIYVAETGPTYETPAEYRMYRMLGGDAVGMSTVPEVIVARHSGLEIFGLSVITNCAKDLSETVQNSEEDVIVQADRASQRMTALFRAMIQEM